MRYQLRAKEAARAEPLDKPEPGVGITDLENT